MLNNHIPSEFTAKISEANQLYQEAFLSFLPESAKGHLLTIQSELSALCKDCIMHSVFATGMTASNAETQSTPWTDDHSTHKVKKVTID